MNTRSKIFCRRFVNRYAESKFLFRLLGIDRQVTVGFFAVFVSALLSVRRSPIRSPFFSMFYVKLNDLFCGVSLSLTR